MFTEYKWFSWPKFFSVDELRELNNVFSQDGDKNFFDVYAGYGTTSELTINLKSVSTIKKTSWQSCKSLVEDIDARVYLTNKIKYGYALHPSSSDLMHNTYNKGDSYGWHQDGSNNNEYDLKFTVVINNSLQSYEGGELQIFQQGGPQTIKELNEPGSVVMFKSDIPHRVTEITKGTRNSIVYWKDGPKFT
tara:strand:- start:282 stop:854 length:573 start_codon:yes stop_codon:yes gene_type:complete